MDLSLRSFVKKIVHIIRLLSFIEKRILLACVVIFLVTGCIFLTRASIAGTVQVPAYGGTLIEGVVGTPRFINPLLAQTPSEYELTSLVYSGLMRKIDEGVYVPDLAKEYSISADGKEYTFVLRDNVRFHDGDRITTADVAFTVEKALDPELKSPRAINWQGVRVSVVDDTTIVFTLSQPFSGFLDTATLGILPQRRWNNQDATTFIYDSENSRPVGSGPYFVRRILNHKDGTPRAYYLHSFKHFALGKPFITRLHIALFNTEKELADALTTRTIMSAASNDIETLSDTKRTTVTTANLARSFGLFFHAGTNKNPLLSADGIRFLEAALDRTRLIQDVYHGYATPLHNMLPPYTDFLNTPSTPPETNDTVLWDIIRSNGWTLDTEHGILRSSSEVSSQPLSLTLTTGNAEHLIATADHIRDQLARFGIEVKVVPYDSASLADTVLAKREFEVLLFGQSFQHDTALFAFWHSSQRNHPGLNVVQYANRITDSLLEKARIENDASERYRLYTQVAEAVSADHVAIFLYAPQMVYYHPRRLSVVIPTTIAEPYDRWNQIFSWSLNHHRVWKGITQ